MNFITITGLPRNVRPRELRNMLSLLTGFVSMELEIRFASPVCFAQFDTVKNRFNAVQRLQGWIFDRLTLNVMFGKENPFIISSFERHIHDVVTAPLYFTRDENGNRCYLYRGDQYRGVVQLSGPRGELKHTIFIVCGSRRRAQQLKSLLLMNSNDDVVSYCSLIHHMDEWLIAIEASQTIRSFFLKRVQLWVESVDQNLSTDQRKKNWYNFIKNDLTWLMLSASKIWAKFVVYPDYSTVLTSNPDLSLYVTDHDQKVKLLPVIENQGGNDIQNLNMFFRSIICLPFEEEDYSDLDRIAGEYGLSLELDSYLYYLTELNLRAMGSKMMFQGHPFTWAGHQRSKFIVRLNEMIKEKRIRKREFFQILQTELDHHPLIGWEAGIRLSNDPVLIDALNHISTKGKVGEIIRFVSNLYRHCNDNVQNTIDLGFDCNEIEMKLERAIPHLYLSLFEGVLTYGMELDWKGEDDFFSNLYDDLF